MLKQIEEHIIEVENFQADSIESVEHFRIKYLGKKGVLNNLFLVFKTVPNEEKKAFGQSLNNLKIKAQEKVDALQEFYGDKEDQVDNRLDLTMSAEPLRLGARHPLSIVKNDIIEVFSRLGFTISEGPEIEDDWHNFSALNLPKEHPARDMQDTFFIQRNPDTLLRTHTSSVQVLSLIHI